MILEKIITAWKETIESLDKGLEKHLTPKTKPLPKVFSVAGTSLRIIQTPEGNQIPRFNIFGKDNLLRFETSKILLEHFTQNPKDIKMSYPLTKDLSGKTYGHNYIQFIHDLFKTHDGILLARPLNKKKTDHRTTFLAIEKILEEFKDTVGGLHLELPQYMKTYVNLLYNQNKDLISRTLLPDTGKLFRSDGLKDRALWTNVDDILVWRAKHTQRLLKTFVPTNPLLPDLMSAANRVDMPLFCMDRFNNFSGDPDSPKGVIDLRTGTRVKPQEYYLTKHLHNIHFKQQIIRYNNIKYINPEKKYLVYGHAQQSISGMIGKASAKSLGSRLDLPTIIFVPAKEQKTCGIYKGGTNTYFLVIPQRATEANMTLLLENTHKEQKMLEDQRAGAEEQDNAPKKKKNIIAA
ncbi:MAG: hypothetical protein ACTSXQ_00290 [Alphaproteobacteria bacterium]